MPSHKAPGFSAVPADLFKQAPAPFQGRIHLLVNEILAEEYDCNQDLLMAKAILIHKVNDIAPLLFDIFLNALVRLLDTTGITHGIRRTSRWNHAAFADETCPYTCAPSETRTSCAT